MAARRFWNTRPTPDWEKVGPGLVEALEQAVADFQDHADHARRRIEDGEEFGARVWRIALEDIAKEADSNRNRARTALAAVEGASHG